MPYTYNFDTGKFDFRDSASSLPIGSFTEGSVIFAGASNLSENNASLFWDDSLESFQIGNRANEGTGIPFSGTTLTTGLRVHDIGGSNIAQFVVHRHSETIAPLILGVRSKSNDTSHVVLTHGQSGLNIFGATWTSAPANEYNSMAGISFEADGTITATNSSGRISLWTTPDSSIIPERAVIIDKAKKSTFLGEVLVNGDITVVVGNINLPATTNDPYGIITVNGNRFIHSWDTNLYFGENAGNFTSTGNYNIGIGENTLTSISSGGLNIAIGAEALTSNQTGNFNIAIGDSALTTNVNGRDNIAIGRTGLVNNISGNNNIALGSLSLNANETGTDNIGIGLQALTKTIGGDDNIGIGTLALGKNTSGTRNVAIGYNSGFSVTTTSNNTFVGTEAGSATTGSDNVFIGNDAGRRAGSISNTLIIDNQDRSSQANEITTSLIYGEFAATTADQSLRINAPVGILTAHQNGVALTVNGTQEYNNTGTWTSGGINLDTGTDLTFDGTSGVIATIDHDGSDNLSILLASGSDINIDTVSDSGAILHLKGSNAPDFIGGNLTLSDRSNPTGYSLYTSADELKLDYNVSSIGLFFYQPAGSLATFNANADSIDYKFRGSGNDNLLYIDGINDRVGINIVPTSSFHAFDDNESFNAFQFSATNVRRMVNITSNADSTSTDPFMNAVNCGQTGVNSPSGLTGFNCVVGEASTTTVTTPGGNAANFQFQVGASTGSGVVTVGDITGFSYLFNRRSTGPAGSSYNVSNAYGAAYKINGVNNGGSLVTVTGDYASLYIPDVLNPSNKIVMTNYYGIKIDDNSNLGSSKNYGIALLADDSAGNSTGSRGGGSLFLGATADAKIYYDNTQMVFDDFTTGQYLFTNANGIGITLDNNASLTGGTIKWDGTGVAAVNDSFHFEDDIFMDNQENIYFGDKNSLINHDGTNMQITDDANIHINAPHTLFGDGEFPTIDAASGNGMKVDSGGTPTFGFRDIIGTPQEPVTGGSRPTFTQIASSGVWAWAFGTTEYQTYVWHIPHDYVPGTDIYFHVHWFGSQTAGNYTNWQVDYLYAQGHQQAAYPTTATTVTSGFQQQQNTTAYYHMIAESNAVTVANLEVDGVIIATVTRIAPVAQTDVSGDVFVPVVDIHYQSTSMPTKYKDLAVGGSFYA